MEICSHEKQVSSHHRTLGRYRDWAVRYSRGWKLIMEMAVKIRLWSKETKKTPNTMFSSSHHFISSFNITEIRYLLCGNLEYNRLSSQDINTPSILRRKGRCCLRNLHKCEVPPTLCLLAFRTMTDKNIASTWAEDWHLL